MAKNDPVGKKIEKLRAEGKPRAQAIATAISMKRAGRLTPEGGYRREEVRFAVGDRVVVVHWPHGYVGMEGIVKATSLPVAKADELGYESMPIIRVSLDNGVELDTGDASCFRRVA